MTGAQANRLKKRAHFILWRWELGEEVTCFKKTERAGATSSVRFTSQGNLPFVA